MNKDESYRISKIIIVLYYCKLSANSLAMILHTITVNEYLRKYGVIMSKNMLNKNLTNKRHKEFYTKNKK